MAVLVKLVISLLLMGIGARWNGIVTGIDLQSQHGRKDRLMNNELITATEFGSNGNGISSECVDLSIESMEVSGNQVVENANGSKGFVKQTDHEHVAGRVSAFADTTFTRSDHKDSIVESDESRLESSDGEVLDFDRTVRLNAGDDMMYVHHGRNKKLKAGNDIKYVHSESKCAGDDMMYVHHGRNKLKAGNDMKNVHSERNNGCENLTVSEVNIMRPSSDGSANRIDRAHFESGSDGSTEMYVEEMSLEHMSAEYCDDISRVVNVIDGAIEVDSLEVSTGDADESKEMSLEHMSAEYCDDSSRVVNVIDGAIEVDSLEVSTGDADESNNSFLYVEGFGQRKERMKVNTCEYDGKSECSVLYVERFGQRKQSSETNTYGSISSLKVDEFGRAINDEDSLKVDEFGRARSEDSLKAEKFSRVGNEEDDLEAAVDESRGSLENRKGNLTYDDLNVKQGRVLSDTRHSQDGTVTKVLAVVEVRGRCEQGDEHDNVKLGRVIDVALHSHDCMGCNEGDTRHRSTARQGVNTDSTMNCSADEMIAQESVLEYDCSLVVLYNDTERCIEREIGIGLDMELKTITVVEVEMSNGHDGSKRERESWRVGLESVEKADNAKVGLATTEMNCDRNDASETHKYNDEKSMTWIGVWILLLITSWRMCSGEQEKYLWRVQELDLRMKDLIRRSMDCMA
eukprot:scaffold14300_cov176-Skeletonema_dohrnii-CCMP3373.AAC.1